MKKPTYVIGYCKHCGDALLFNEDWLNGRYANGEICFEAGQHELERDIELDEDYTGSAKLSGYLKQLQATNTMKFS